MYCYACSFRKSYASYGLVYLMKQSLVLFIVLFFISCSQPEQLLNYALSAKLSETKKAYFVKSASYVSLDSLATKIKNYPVIFIGDHHNQGDLHKNIAALIKALQSQGKRVLLANEWFTPEHNQYLQAYKNKTIDEKTFLEKVQWKKRIGITFNSFKPIYDTVIKGNGELFGINLSKVEQQNISQRHFIKMGDKEKAFYKSLDLNVTIHKNMLAPFFDACHAYKSKNNEDCSKRMYRVQVAWDSKMALEVDKLSSKLKRDDMLIVLAGSMHLENGIGINLRFARLNNRSFFTVIPLSNKELKLPNGLADGAIFYELKIDKKH